MNLVVNRYYDPTTGRFTQEDPIGLAGGMNLYGFASGDPINFSDPFGLSPCCSAQEVADIAISFVPGLSTLDDAVTAITGSSLAGSPVDGGGRLMAVAGLAIPGASGGQVRIGVRAATKGVEGIYEFSAKSGKKYIGE